MTGVVRVWFTAGTCENSVTFNNTYTTHVVDIQELNRSELSRSVGYVHHQR